MGKSDSIFYVLPSHIYHEQYAKKQLNCSSEKYTQTTIFKNIGKILESNNLQYPSYMNK